MKKGSFIVAAGLALALSAQVVSAQVIAPKARGTNQGGPTIDQAQSEDAMGAKARVAVTRFADKTAKGGGQIGDGMAEMLGNALFSTNRFIILERQSLKDVMREQDLATSGRIRQDTAAPTGEIEGADLLIQGTITEFEPGQSGGGGGVGGFLPGTWGRAVGSIAGSVKSSHLALIVKVIDARTSRVLASEQVQGKATDIGGMAGMGNWNFAASLGAYSKTPMEKAIRVCIEEAVRLIVAKTPPEYYRAGQAPAQQPAQQGYPAQQPAQQAAPAAASQGTGSAPQSSDTRMVYVKWPTVSLREGPGSNYKGVADVQKGTALAVLEDRGQWLLVGTEDGREGWIGRGTVSDNP